MSEGSTCETENKNINKDVIEAVNLLAHGKRNILCGEILQAVSQLQEACRILGSEYGELADECADAYLWYGKALLELSRLENGVLGDAIPGGESEDSDNSADDSSEEENSPNEGNGIEDELEEGIMSEDLEEDETREIREESSSLASDQGKTVTKGDEEANTAGISEISDTDQKVTCPNNVQVNVDKGLNDKQIEVTTHVQNEGNIAATNVSSSNTEDNDDVSNLQLAWEILELSKIIYQRHERDDMKLKLAETHLKLGEIGMETEQYDQSINDLKKCLQLQRDVLPQEDRRLAETLYQLGLACTYSRQYDYAVNYYRNAMAVIQMKIDHLERVVAREIPPDIVENGDGFYTPLELAQKDIDELRELLPDISAKIDDVRDEQGDADKVKVLMQESVVVSGLGCSQPLSVNFEGASSSVAKTLPLPVFTKPVNNITHLVRKKRKLDEPKEQTDLSKRQKTAAEEINSETSSANRNNIGTTEESDGAFDNAAVLLKSQESQQR